MMIGIDVPQRLAARWLSLYHLRCSPKMEHTLSMSLGCLAVQADKQTTITKGTQNARVLIALHRFQAKRQAALADPLMRRAQAQAHRVLSPS